MKRRSQLLPLALVAFATAVVTVIGLVLQTKPLLTMGADLTMVEVDRARMLWQENDPRRYPPGVERYLDLSQSDADLLLGLASRRLGKPSLRLLLGDGSAILQASVRLEALPFDPWFNVVARLHVVSGLPQLDGMRIGRLPLPRSLSNLIVRRVMRHMEGAVETKHIADMIQSMHITPGRLQLAYRWNVDSPSRLKSLLVSRADIERLRAYQERIAAAAARLAPAQSISVPDLLTSVFALAQRRSATTDASSENRAAIVVMAFYASGRDLTDLTPEAQNWPAAEYRVVTLDNRIDLARHFLISAALAAESDSALAEVIGLYKEVDDSRGGSGFSFADVAANRAGSRFGHLAVLAPGRLQNVLAAGITEADFMPDLRGLPESLPEAEFKRRYGGPDAPAYQMMTTEIEARISARPLFR